MASYISKTLVDAPLRPGALSTPFVARGYVASVVTRKMSYAEVVRGKNQVDERFTVTAPAFPAHPTVVYLQWCYNNLTTTRERITLYERYPTLVGKDTYWRAMDVIWHMEEQISLYTPPPPPRPRSATVDSTQEDTDEQKAWNDFLDFDWYKLTAWKNNNKLPSTLADKNRRKRQNRSARRAAERVEKALIEEHVVTQSGGKKQVMPTVSRNILSLRAKGIFNHEITDLMRSKSFEKVVFSTKQVNRIYRDILQVRSALAKTKEAREQLDHRVVQADIQRTRAIERCAKYAENQAFGPIIHAGSIALAGISGLVAALKIKQGVQQIGNGTKAMAAETVKIFDIIVEKLKGFSVALGDIGVLLKSVLTAVFVYFLFKTFRHPLIRAAVLASIPVIFSQRIRNSISDIFSQLMNKPEVVNQSIEEQDDLLPGLIATTVLGTIACEDKRGLKVGMVDAVGKVPRTVKGIEALMDWGAKAVERCLNVILRWLGRPEVKFRKELNAEVEKQIQIAEELDRHMRSNEFENSESPKMFQKCSECYAQLGTLMMMHHENVKVRQILSPYRATMAGHIGTLRSTLGRGAGFRQEPLSVLIESNPGVGKTMQVPVLIGTVLQQAGLVDKIEPGKLHECFFSRPANSDFFDGYYGQECYLIDDVFARIQNPNGLTQFDEVMAFYGTTTCMLNMADLPKKGMYPFTSSLLMMTTNLKDLDSAGVGSILIQPEAFKRRVDIHVHLEVKPQYQLLKGNNLTGQLDYSLFEKERLKLVALGKKGMDAHPWYMWEAWDTYFGNTNGVFVSGTGRCFSRVVHEIIAGLRQKSMFHKGNMEHLENVFASPSQNPVNQVGEGSTVKLPFVPDDDQCLLDACIRYGKVPSIEQLDYEVNTTPPPVLERSLDPQTVKSTYKDLLQAVKDTYNSMSSFDQFLFAYCASLMAYITVWNAVKYIIKPVVKGIMGFFQGTTETLVGEEQSNGPKPKKLIIRNPITQVADFSLWEKVYNASYKMLVDVGGMSYAPFGQIIFISGNIAVMPHHFLDQISSMKAKNEINDDSPLMFKPANGYVQVDTTLRAFLSYPNFSLPDEDLHFVCFKKGFRMFPDISKFLVTEADLHLISGRRVRLDVAAADDDGTMLPICNRETYTSESVKLENTTLRTDTRAYRRYLSYNANTERGDCGAPLCLTDYRNFNNRLFAGIHVAGMEQCPRGFATPLTQEIYQKASERFAKYTVKYTEASIEESQLPDSVQLQSIDSLPFGIEGRFGNAIPLYQTSAAVSAPVKSALVKTFIGEAEYFKAEIAQMNDGHEPPHLVPMKMGRFIDKETGETVYPMAEALRPYVEGVFLPVDNSFALGLSAGLKPFADATRDYPAPVLNCAEAVVGLPQLGLKSITRATSVGYPLCTFAKNKKYFFGSEDDLDVTTPEALELFDKIEKLLDVIRQNKRPLFICRDFLKDEVRKLGKKARLIAGTDLCYYLLCRMYFGAFVGAVGRSHEYSGMCLGMNPYSEWGHLRRMLEKPDPTGRNVWDGDFAGFDSSQMPQLLWDCLDYINNWYTVRGGPISDNQIRTILFLDLAYSRHITGFHGPADTIVEWSKSLPSGHFLTSTINSMLSMGLVASGFVALTGETDFWGNSAAISMGDDNVVSTSDEYVERFNQVTLSAFIKKAYGMEYTAGRKGEALVPTIGIDKVVFLQRRWAVKDGYDVCPIRPESFLHSLYYVHSQDQTKNRTTLLASIESAFEELSMHDESYWRPVADKLVKLKNMLGEAPASSVVDSSAYLDVVRNRIPSYV